MVNGIFPLVNVDNLDKSIEFYKALGLKTSKVTMGPMTWANVNSGDATLMLFPKHEIAPDQPADTRAWLSGELGKGVVIQMGVPNAQKTYEKAKSNGFTIDETIRDAEWGGKMFMVNDPDGYEIAIVDRLPNVKKATTTRRPKANASAKSKSKGKAKPKRKGR